MTHKEAIKNLTELQIRLINDNSEEATEYNKKIYETFAYFITQTIPLSVIEKITETMEVEYASADELADDRFGGGYSYYRGKASGIKWVKGIIDKAVKEIEKDANM